MTKKMTIREFLHLVTEGDISEEVIEFAHDRIDKLDEKNARRSAKSSEKREENLKLLPEIYEVMGDEIITVAELKEKLDADCTSAKLSALLKLGVEQEQGQVKKIVPEKRHKPLGYQVVQ